MSEGNLGNKHVDAYLYSAALCTSVLISLRMACRQMRDQVCSGSLWTHRVLVDPEFPDVTLAEPHPVCDQHCEGKLEMFTKIDNCQLT